MNKILADLEAAIAAEKIKTQALSVIEAQVASIKARLIEHQAQSAIAPAPAPVPK